MIDIRENVALKDYSTMRLGGPAHYLTEVKSLEEAIEAIQWAKQKGLELVIIGGGANVVFRDKGFDGLVIIDRISGYEVLSENDSNVVIKIGAGENWDSVVARSVESGLYGLESLSHIPGTAGAAPVQNIGAYGQQISQSVVALDVYDLTNGKNMLLSKEECNFHYRSSRFNREDKGRFMVLSITLSLSKSKPESKQYYKDVEEYFTEYPPVVIDARAIREAVIAIRTRKLPNPLTVANCGSFFYNPTIDQEPFLLLHRKFPELKSHTTDDGKQKLYAAQLIDLAGLKALDDPKTGMALWPDQSLVLINKSAQETSQLLDFRDKIINSVFELFGIELIQEPELI